MEGAEISLSGNRIAYARRYLAFHPNRRGEDRTVVVRDLRSSKIVYRARGDWSSLGADGTLATALFNDPVSFAGTLSWYSPASPRRRRLPNRVEVFSSSPLVYAGGRIAYIRSYDVRGAELAVTDLDGNETIHARFQAPEQLEAFAFDGSRLAFAHTRFRRDQGSSDDGLPSICVGDDVLVQPNATVVEVHQLTDATRMPAAQLPSVPAYRSAAAERPECPTRD